MNKCVEGGSMIEDLARACNDRYLTGIDNQSILQWQTIVQCCQGKQDFPFLVNFLSLGMA
jgi:hypothetical protein